MARVAEPAAGIAIFGATSAIAQAVARIYAAEGARFFLAGRNAEHLLAVAEDLRVRGASDVRVEVADFRAVEACAPLCDTARQALGAIDVALVAHGTLPDQSLCERDDDALREELAVNFTSHACLLMGLAGILEAQRHGSLVAIGSAAGDRGKRRNYVYGAAKGGIAVLVQGLMGRLARAGVTVTLVKPGFVDTPMTASFAKGLLWISAESAGRTIVRAIRRGRSTVYVPWFWRWIMAILRVVPERLLPALTSELPYRDDAPVWALSAVAALAGCMAVAFFPLPADDAYIVARYATQIAGGRGMVYNEGELVNALTSPVHLGALVALQPIANDFVSVYRALCAVAVAAVLVTFAWRRWGRSWTAAYFLALTLACPFVAFWTVGGLETPILLCVLTAIAFLAQDEDDAGGAAAIVLLSALAVLIRHDAVLFVGPVGVYAAWRHRAARVVRAALGAGAVVVIGWIGFTLSYFGDILPTSFYVKAGRAPSLAELGRGALYVASFLCLTWIWIAFAMPKRARLKNLAARMLWAGFALTLAYALFASTRHMMYGYRLLVPYVPALAIALLASRGALARGRAATFAALLAWQAALAAFFFFYSQNPSLSLLAEGASEQNERFEFSHVGARHTGSFLATAQGQAEAIRTHWAATGLGATRPPRVVASTGGALPYLLPEAYVLEQLVSFRHHCKPALEPLADYAQVIYVADTADEVAQERGRQEREVVARFTLEADGLRAAPMPLVVEIWFRPASERNPLPAKVREPCR